MVPCPSCGSALDSSRPLPPRCPYCGVSLDSKPSTGFGAPPVFAGSPDESGAATIFVPAAESGTHEVPSLAAPRRRQPPSTPGFDLSGPPAIGLDDMDRHGELDLGGGDGELELDFTGGPGMAEPPPPIAAPADSGIDFPVPVADPLADLPGPVTRGSGPVTDLPGPVTRPDPAADLVAPKRPGPPAAPRRPGGAPPRPPAGSANAPTRPEGTGARPRPAAGPPPADAFTLDLPVPVEQARASFGASDAVSLELDLPPVGGGPGPLPEAELDLPIPADLPMPSSRGQELRPADMNLRPADMNLRPVEMGLTPAEMNLTPADQSLRPLAMDLEPIGLDIEPKRNEAARPAAHGSSAPTASPTAASPGLASPGVAAPTRAAVRVPTPPKEPSRGVSRGVLYLGGGLLLLGLVGAGVLYSGILDEDLPDPNAQGSRGVPKPSGDGGKGTVPDSGDPSAAAERSPAVLAKMAAHTPASYLEAYAMANESGDKVGSAEAALLLHYHYGPDPALAAVASATLQGLGGATDEFVTRVIGLGSLAAGNLEGAEQALTGEGPRTRLYRGWLRLAQGKLDEAQAEGEAVLAALPDEVGARHLVLAVQVRRDPAAAVAAIEAVVQRNPEHPGLQATLAEAALAVGQLAVARTAVDTIDPKATDDAGVQAWSYVQRARVRRAQGEYEGAIAAYDGALERVPGAVDLQTARIRVLLAAKRFNDASTAVSALVREHAQDHEVQLLQVEVAVHSGDGDLALKILETLATALPKDARVKRLEGEVHSMRLEVEEGKAAFAAARELDPTDVRASIGEAELLADAKQVPAGLEVLDAAITAAAERPGDVATLLVAKAKLLREAGDRVAALVALDRALEAVPGHNDAQVMRGTLRIAEGRLAEGRLDLIDVFERTGGYPGLAGPLGGLYVREGDFEALEKLVEGGLGGDQTPDDQLLVGARLRLHQGRTDDAAVLVDRALTRRPSDWEAHMLKAQVLIAQGLPVEALAAIERSRPAEPQPELMLQRGKVLEFNGKHGEAVPEYRRALELQPDLHEARFLYGRLLAYDGANGKAIVELNKVATAASAATAPWFPEVWLNIGRAQQGLGKLDDAIASLRKATDLNPKLGEAWALEGRFHEYRNDHGKAVTALTKAVELGTKADHWYAGALMDLGRAQAKSGKGAAAKKTLAEFLSVAPADNASRAEAERLLREL